MCVCGGKQQKQQHAYLKCSFYVPEIILEEYVSLCNEIKKKIQCKQFEENKIIIF